MNRNSNYIITKIKDPLGHAKKAQVGVDLTLAKAEKVSGFGIFEGDSKLNRDWVHYEEIPTYKEYYESHKEELKSIYGDNIPDVEKYGDAYYFEPNSHFVIEFEQGMERLNPNEWAFLYHRSSINRAGSSFLSSCVWDPNFSTDIMGTSFHTGSIPLIVPKGTRIAQMLIFDCEEVPPEDLYNGQWQGVANH